MKLPSIPYLSSAFARVVQRFPLVMLVALTGVVCAMVLIEHQGDMMPDNFEKLFITSVLGVPLLLAMAILAEKWRLAGLVKWLPSAIGVLLLVLYYFTLDIRRDNINMGTSLFFGILFVTAHLAVAIAPYSDRTTSVEDFWEYNKRLLGNFIVAVFYSNVIYAGLSVAILAVDNLFNLKINGEIYAHLFFIMAGIVNTAIFLAHFPERYQGIASEDGPYTTIVKYLSKFILIPIVIIYFLILYAFSIKILVTWELPEGWVSKLVLGFSLAGILTYLLNYMIAKYDDSRLPKLYRRWFFYVLLPMIALLFISIGRRISDYGVTELRYIVLAMGIWLLIVSLYFIISGKDNIKIIPASLIIIALFTALGPFSAFRVSRDSQVDRLEKILKEEGLFVDGKIVAPEDSISQESAEDLRSILFYLREYEHFQAVAPWFDIPADSIASYETIHDIETRLKIDNYSPRNFSCFYNFPTRQPSAVEGYEQVIQLDVFTSVGQQDEGWLFTIGDERLSLNLYNNGELIDNFYLEPELRELTDKYPCDKGTYPSEAASIEASGEVYEIKLQIRNLSLQKKERIELERLEGICLLKPVETEG